MFVWGPRPVDNAGVLPPLGQTSNGPEIGFDGNLGYEIVYTQYASDGVNWQIARALNVCPGAFSATCFHVKGFVNVSPPYQNRWAPFVTQNSQLQVPEAASVVYNATPGAPIASQKLKVFRVLEGNPTPPETTISGTNAHTVGRWVRIDDKDYIISTLGSQGDPVVNVVLYDPDDLNLTPIPLTLDHPGQHAIGSIGWDAAAPNGGQYTLVTVRTDPASGHTFMEIFQRQSGTWLFRYEFDAPVADPALPANWHVTSPEPFEYMSHLYFAFVAADHPDFSSITKGNIMITRVEEDTNPSDNHYRILNACDQLSCNPNTTPTHKRIEPEIHYLSNDRPIIFYSLTTNADTLCGPNVSRLMRALPGELWSD